MGRYANPKPTAVYKALGTTRSNTIVVAADPDLTIPVFANSLYIIKALIVWDGDGNTVGGIKIRVGTGSGAVRSMFYTANTNTSIGSVASNSSPGTMTNISGSFEKLPSIVNATDHIVIDGLIQTVNATNIYVQWAQSGVTGLATRVQAYSFLSVQKI